MIKLELTVYIYLSSKNGYRIDKMIVVRTPHRVSFFGGGSDFEDHIKLDQSFSGVFGMAVNLFSYVSATFPTVPVKDRFRISYSRTENAAQLSELDHELARETLRYFDFNAQIHISSMSDVPASTGLGTSSSFTVGLVRLLSIKLGISMSQREIAKAAIEIERYKAGHSGGIQDQFWAAHGGVGYYDFKTEAQSLKSAPMVLEQALSANSYICYLGGQRSSSKILDSRPKIKATESLADGRNLLGRQACRFDELISTVDPESLNKEFSASLIESWTTKKMQIRLNDEIHDVLKEFEHLNVPFKLCGAGGTGFLYFFLPTDEIVLQVTSIIKKYGWLLLKILPANKGVEVVYHDK